MNEKIFLEHAINKKIEPEKIKAEEYKDFRGQDLSDFDLNNFTPEILETSNFNTKTKWPKKVPEGFDPNKILEEGKNPGLKLRELHKEGITGKGINVAIIDQELLLDHEDYKENIEYYDHEEGKHDRSMHGVAVSSLLVGKNCGIAPNSKLHYFAVPQNTKVSDIGSALKKLIEHNEHLPKENKIKIVSISKGLVGMKDQDPKEEADILNMIKEAERNGIMVVSVSMKKSGDDFDFLGIGTASENKDDFDNYKNWLSLKARRIETSPEKKEKNIFVPSDHRTMASFVGEKEYQYNGKGGISWSVPYLAGVFALALQVNPDLTKKEILEKIKQTAIPNKEGLKVINPMGLIKLIKSEKELSGSVK